MTPESAVCRWEISIEGCWMTDCEWTFGFEFGDPEENGFAFCPFCGRELVASGC